MIFEDILALNDECQSTIGLLLDKISRFIQCIVCLSGIDH